MDFATARVNMVDSQIRTNRVSDPVVIQALAETPREIFVPKPMRGFAYVDDDIDIGGGRYLMEPLVLARLLQGAGIKPTDVVLNIGDSTGYTTAVISRLAQTVVALESDAEWVGRATACLSELAIDNAAVVHGPLQSGFPVQAPYDVIVFSGAVGEIPAGITRQLVDGGRLVAVIKPGRGAGVGTLVVRAGDTFGRRPLFDASTPALPGFEGKEGFVL